MELDINSMRQRMINAFQLRRTDEKFTFYYDETNNIRKFYLTDNGTNTQEHKNFILGGIVLTEGQSLPDIALLRAKLRIQSNTPEIKFSHIAKGDFEEVLCSKKLGIVLSWIIEHGISIHYSSVNIIYWSIVSIIDSILADDKFKDYQPHHEVMKNELYRLVNLDKLAFLTLMKRHRYPDIERGKAADFIVDVHVFLNDHSSEGDNLPALMLKSLIENSGSLSELTFLTDEQEDILIESFHIFYTRPIMLFRNSIHIFDSETQIEKIFNGERFKDYARQVTFSFADSKSEPGIQIADVMSGLLGKYQSFVEDHSLTELLERKSSWSEMQITNITLLRQLIDLSDEVSNAFIHRTTAMDSMWKNDAFMHGLQPLSHLL